ncbi:hypothetical protein AK812_SmicGene30767, partial [Symbiodinium microadriaticum]
ADEKEKEFSGEEEESEQEPAQGKAQQRVRDGAAAGTAVSGEHEDKERRSFQGSKVISIWESAVEIAGESRTVQFIRIFRFIMALRTLVTSIFSTLKAG